MCTFHIANRAVKVDFVLFVLLVGKAVANLAMLQMFLCTSCMLVYFVSHYIYPAIPTFTTLLLNLPAGAILH